ncbi:MBL fold metallo-hydrolase [Paucihalobacter ruber]|uniref:MBL fold metallo-hydrolase n=1 Tax=Paucihalobacter ruber TaxID=2567861 RepID=A0A506PNV8_9FLAO|nr:MBL fold metallo-hydrolase [Paucihalobacter ruber]TPV35381.1 MBL fold metallo-hydrolase [Paucihalobacter ruber]
MYFELVYDKSLAQASYIIGCQKSGIVAIIDPKRDIDTYLKIAKKNNFKITHILETHIHADFLCGSRELAAITGGELYLSDEGDEDWKYEFPHNKLKHGYIVKIGNISIEALHTPGHTPEHLSFLLTDHPATDKPAMLFTGDFVFVGDVGRPDLLEQAAGLKGTQEKGAHDLFNSLQDFVKMADFILLWPGHGAGSACGKALGAVHMSTIGYEKIRNWALQLLHDKAKFTEELLSNQPEPPRYFAMMKKLNKVERKLITEVPKIKNLNQPEYQETKKKNLKLIDTRPKEQFSKHFLKGAINIPNNNSFSTWMGWFLNYQEYFVLVATPDEVEDLTRKLMRIGMDNIYGFITPEQLLAFEKGPLSSYNSIDKQAVKQKLKDTEVQIIDIRGKSEYNEGHIDGAKNVFMGTMDENLNKIDNKKQVIIYCGSGNRSAIAYSLLTANGFNNILNYGGGWSDWKS